MMQNYDMKIQEKAERVFSVMEKRVSAQDVERIRAAFELAKFPSYRCCQHRGRGTDAGCQPRHCSLSA